MEYSDRTWYGTLKSNPAEKAWYDKLSDSVKKIVDQYPPIYLYKLRPPNREITPQLVSIVSYIDTSPATLTVAVTREYNHTAMERRVFGILATDLKKVCRLDESDHHKINWKVGEREFMDKLDQEITELLPIWHQEIDKVIVDLPRERRADIINSRIDDYITTRLEEHGRTHSKTKSSRNCYED